MDSTPLAQLASHHLGEPVADWIRRRRAERKVSLRDVVDELRERTGLSVSPQTIANWSGGDEPPAVPEQQQSDQPAVADAG